MPLLAAVTILFFVLYIRSGALDERCVKCGSRNITVRNWKFAYCNDCGART